MNNRPLQVEELFIKSFDLKSLRERSGLPHPLSKFASNGAIKDGPCADTVLQFIKDLSLSEPESARRNNAQWFLLESEKAFFVACYEAGVDAGKLRSHLLKCVSGGICDEELEV